MGDSGQAQGARGAGTSLLGTVLAGGGACDERRGGEPSPRDPGVHGQEQLIGWVLLGLPRRALCCASISPWYGPWPPQSSSPVPRDASAGCCSRRCGCWHRAWRAE